MIFLNTSDKDFNTQLARYTTRHAYTEDMEKTAAKIIQDVKTRGDEAILDCLKKYDNVVLKDASEFEVTPNEFKEGANTLNTSERRAVRAAIDSVYHFAREEIPDDWIYKPRIGVKLGERFTPMERVAIYIPGGTAPLVSTVIHTAMLAKAAGVKEVVAFSPPQADGSVNPYILGALRLSGVTECYRLGGAYAIAAAAYGTKTIRKVEKIVGPGNGWVTAAKKLVYGDVAIDMVAGPSEVMIIADKTARPKWVAADLLSQLEHGGGNLAILATPSADLIKQVEAEINIQVENLSRQKLLQEGLASGCILIQTQSVEEAGGVATSIAPEHVEIQCEDPEAVMEYVTAAGAVFLGHYTPEVVGDFMAGPSHVLPTAGSARYFSGLSAQSFFRRMSFVRYSDRALSRECPMIESIAKMEGLDAHKNSARIRLED